MPHVRAVCGKDIRNAFPRHAHSSFCIGMVDRGSRIITHGKASEHILENGLFVIPPGTSHTCEPGEKKGHSYRIIAVSEKTLQTLASQISEKAEGIPCFGNIAFTDEQIARDMRRFFSLPDAPHAALERESVLTSLLTGLILRHAEKQPLPCQAGQQRQAVERAREYMAAHYPDNISLGQLANIACLSPFHFQRVFLKATGMSPSEYLLHLRIRRALTRLSEGAGLADTGLAVGFSDQSHFTRCFRHVVGIPPGKYLRLNR